MAEVEFKDSGGVPLRIDEAEVKGSPAGLSFEPLGRFEFTQPQVLWAREVGLDIVFGQVRNINLSGVGLLFAFSRWSALRGTTFSGEGALMVARARDFSADFNNDFR